MKTILEPNLPELLAAVIDASQAEDRAIAEYKKASDAQDQARKHHRDAIKKAIEASGINGGTKYYLIKGRMLQATTAFIFGYEIETDAESMQRLYGPRFVND